jgi:hypothetical protein
VPDCDIEVEADCSADPDRLKYDNGTFNACSNDGDYVSLDWTGGDVTIVGATKPKQVHPHPGREMSLTEI